MRGFALLLLTGGACAETLRYKAEWRLMDAGIVELAYGGGSARLTLETQGFVNSLYRVKDEYVVTHGAELCAQATRMLAQEGGKKREIGVTFRNGKSELVERDLLAGQVVSTRQLDVPACVFDVVMGLAKLRKMSFGPGKPAEIPVSDGKKSITARVEAQAREKVKTPAGEFACTRYEVFLFNDVLYRRKGRLFLWMTDDARRTPVQIRVQFAFLFGTVTLQLEKEILS